MWISLLGRVSRQSEHVGVFSCVSGMMYVLRRVLVCFFSFFSLFFSHALYVTSVSNLCAMVGDYRQSFQQPKQKKHKAAIPQAAAVLHALGRSLNQSKQVLLHFIHVFFALSYESCFSLGWTPGRCRHVLATMAQTQTTWTPYWILGCLMCSARNTEHLCFYRFGFCQCILFSNWNVPFLRL